MTESMEGSYRGIKHSALSTFILSIVMTTGFRRNLNSVPPFTVLAFRVMQQTTRVAVIGCGNMGRNHIRVLMDMPEVRLVGVADSNLTVAHSIADKYGIQVFPDCPSLLANVEPDALIVAVPTAFHHEVVMKALASGKHVLVEKPVASTIREANDMIAAARRRRRVLAVGHIERFNPAVIELKKRIHAGELGRVFMIHARRQSPFPKRIQDMGVASDLAVHELDMMTYLAGSDVKRMSAEVSQVLRHPTREDIVLGLLRFKNGILGVLDVNWVTPTTVRELSITGEKGMFVVNYLSQELLFYENPAARKNIDGSVWDFSVDAGNMTRFQIQRREPLRSELESFVHSVRTGTPPVVDGRAGLKALTLAVDIAAGRRTGRWTSTRKVAR